MTTQTTPATWPKFKDMTPEQKAAWGAAEAAARAVDLTDKTLAGLRRAQANAEERRKAIGASNTAATALVIDANRTKRREA